MKKQILALLSITTLALAGDFVNSIGMRFKEIPAGSFIMGADASECLKLSGFEYEMCLAELGYYPSEMPPRLVFVKSFYMLESEVTEKQYCLVVHGFVDDRFCKSGNCDFDKPKEFDWDMAVNFVNSLNKLEKTNKYAIPTEAQWEYAARAGKKYKWICGDVVSCLSSVAVYNTKQSYPVKSKKPNEWGLYDMTGNMYEYVRDCWQNNYVGLGSSAEIANEKCDEESHTLRGGGWEDYDPMYLRITNRIKDTPIYYRSRGLRIIRIK